MDCISVTYLQLQMKGYYQRMYSNTYSQKITHVVNASCISVKLPVSFSVNFSIGNIQKSRFKMLNTLISHATSSLVLSISLESQKVLQRRQRRQKGMYQFIGILIMNDSAAGVSRSSSLVLAYMMYSLKEGLNECFAKLKKSRSVIWPNNGFYKQLQKFEKELGLTSKVPKPGFY